MANQQNWNIRHEFNVPVQPAVDVTRGQVGKITANNVGNVAGAGDVPSGVYFLTVDVSEDDTPQQLMTQGEAVCKCGAVAISDLTIPVKPSTSGTVVSATTDKDSCLGWPLNTALVGEDVRVRLQVGMYYTV
jgi:hypothetical protein